MATRRGGDVKQTGNAPTLRPGLITSFDLKGFCHPTSPVMDAVYEFGGCSANKLGPELYLFMQRDVEYLIQSLSISIQPSEQHAVGLLKAAGRSTTVAKRIAAYLDELLLSHDLLTVSIATFIPEVSSLNSNEWTSAALAIAGAIRIAANIKQKCVKKLPVEMVCGSRIASLLEMSTADCESLKAAFRDVGGMARLELEETLPVNTTLVAELASQEELQKSLTDVLRLAIRLSRESPILALELEPGPIFTLDGFDSLTRLCHTLNQDTLLSPIVGFNLDIAHWALAGIVPEDVRRQHLDHLDQNTEGLSILQRVVHSHIAGYHPCGHIDDTFLLADNSPNQVADYSKWIELLRDRIQMQSLLQFTQHTSLEFEAAKDYKAVGVSVAQLVALLE